MTDGTTGGKDKDDEHYLCILMLVAAAATRSRSRERPGTSGKPSHPDGFRIIGLFTLLSRISVNLVALRQNAVRQARKNADTPARLFRFYLDRLKPIS